MIGNVKPLDFYNQKLLAIADLVRKAKARRALLAWVRSGTVLLALAGAYMAWEHKDIFWLFAVVGGLSAFGRAIVLDVNNNARIRRLERLSLLIEQELAFVADGRQIPGNDVSPLPFHDHPYAYDLDIFGHSSVFAMVNRCPSEIGRNLLGNWLLEPASPETVKERQAAVRELAQTPDSIFDLFAMGREMPLRHDTVQRVLSWLKQGDEPFTEKYWGLVRWIYPVVTLTVLGFYAAGLMPSSVFGLCFILFLGISFSFSKKVIHHYTALSGIVKQISVLSESSAFVERLSLNSPLNKKLQDTLTLPAPASLQIKALDGLLSRFDYRLNPYVFIFLNSFLAWDLWQMHGLSRWRNRNRDRVEQWVASLTEMEALGSLALLHFNQPGWCFPEIVPAHFEFSAAGLGHPLIPVGKRVSNDFSSAGKGHLDLVTGSNMAGKSTFLRTIGVNMVLAMAGSPVCAETCTLSPVSVASSMRVADNLEDSTSTFYAELKKLRSIIDRVNRKEPIFILLDEILRGTNSRDRLAGSKALVRQLIRKEAVGVIATHDLELAEMEGELPGHIHNYYFDVHFFGDQLDFDYTLRHGVCTTKNAELLMKQIGIEM